MFRLMSSRSVVTSCVQHHPESRTSRDPHGSCLVAVVAHPGREGAQQPIGSDARPTSRAGERLVEESRCLRGGTTSHELAYGPPDM